MSHDAFKERGQALENAYIKKRERELLAHLAQAQTDGLAAASGLEEEDVERLRRWKVTAEMLPALHLVPLIEVAWADGRIKRVERRLVEQALESRGIARDSAAWGFIDGLLAEQPLGAFFADMRAILAASIRHQSKEEAASTTVEVMTWARKVAASTGGFLGFGPKVDDTEGAVLRELAAELAAAYPEEG